MSRARPNNASSDILLLPDGRKLGYAQFGSPTGRAIFFAHGHPGSRLDAAHLHEAGLKVGARIIAADRPGMGWSSPHPDRTLLDYPKELEHLADHLKLERYGVLTQPCARLDLSEEQRLELHMKAFSKPKSTAEKKDAELMTDEVTARRCLQSNAASFAQGYDAALQDGRLLSSDFGFRIQDIRADLPVQLWYGNQDVYVPLHHGETIAKRLECLRDKLQTPDEENPAAWVNLHSFVAKVESLIWSVQVKPTWAIWAMSDAFEDEKHYPSEAVRDAYILGATQYILFKGQDLIQHIAYPGIISDEDKRHWTPGPRYLGPASLDLARWCYWKGGFQAAAAQGVLTMDDGGRVNSKAQLRIPLSQLCPLVPPVLHRGLRQSRYYAASSDSLLIQADDSRKQTANRDACYRRLTELVTEVYKASVPGETSQAQKERVKQLKTQYNESRLQGKKMRSSKKAARSKGFGD
ncbi:hypothetical protein DV737_g5566, partial [Chaetothyriales sp. CBS 132003]